MTKIAFDKIQWYLCYLCSTGRVSYQMLSLSSLQYRTSVLSNDIFVISTVQDGCLIKCYICRLYSTWRVSYQMNLCHLYHFIRPLSCTIEMTQIHLIRHPSYTVEMTKISFDKTPVMYYRNDTYSFDKTRLIKWYLCHLYSTRRVSYKMISLSSL
jgi:hypothetical protein